MKNEGFPRENDKIKIDIHTLVQWFAEAFLKEDAAQVHKLMDIYDCGEIKKNPEYVTMIKNGMVLFRTIRKNDASRRIEMNEIIEWLAQTFLIDKDSPRA